MKEQMMVSWLFLCAWFPLVLISRCYFQNAPFACHYYVCMCNCVFYEKDRGEQNEQWCMNVPQLEFVYFSSDALTLFWLLLSQWGEIHLIWTLGEMILFLLICSLICSLYAHTPEFFLFFLLQLTAQNGCHLDWMNLLDTFLCPSFNCLLWFLFF